eukprot:GHVU01026147.1.p2 GENE.GHVU01026147.1~~GHVU01026147.1.p2  ORF type:complete len:101 (-),score=4.71 GHVU01026147.1:327-629(-)
MCMYTYTYVHTGEVRSLSSAVSQFAYNILGWFAEPIVSGLWREITDRQARTLSLIHSFIHSLLSFMHSSSIQFTHSFIRTIIVHSFRKTGRQAERQGSIR